MVIIVSVVTGHRKLVFSTITVGVSDGRFAGHNVFPGVEGAPADHRLIRKKKKKTKLMTVHRCYCTGFWFISFAQFSAFFIASYVTTFNVVIVQEVCGRRSHGAADGVSRGCRVSRVRASA